MNSELKAKIEELLLLAKSQGVSIAGLVDTPSEGSCHIFKSLEVDSKAGIRHLYEIMTEQPCSQDKKCCKSCHLRA